ncbi:unnamed protein product [Musa textilis]
MTGKGRDEALQIRYDLMTITIQARARRSLALRLPARPRNVIPVALPRSTRPNPPPLWGTGHRRACRPRRRVRNY